MKIHINTQLIFKAMLSVSFLLIGLCTFITLGHMQEWDLAIFKFWKWFNLNVEYNIPTFYSTVNLLVASFLLLLITIREYSVKNKDYKFWGLLHLGFVFLAFDEAVCIHEAFVSIGYKLFNLSGSGVFKFSWVIFGFAIIVFLFILFYKFVFRIPKNVRNTFIIAAAMYLGGGLVLEFIGGAYCGLLNLEKVDFIYFALMTMEESLEILGIVVLIKGLLTYLFPLNGVIQLKNPVNGNIQIINSEINENSIHGSMI